MPPFCEVDSCSKNVIWGGGEERSGPPRVCILMSSFTLFRTKYVTYLKTFWCKFLMRVLMLDFEILSLVTFFL